MKRRAKATLPPAVPGTPNDGEPIDQRDHFMHCPTCGHMIDMQGPAEVREHYGPPEAPTKN